MLKVENILREDFDWEDVEIDEDEFDELETALIIDYLKKNTPKGISTNCGNIIWKVFLFYRRIFILR